MWFPIIVILVVVADALRVDSECYAQIKNECGTISLPNVLPDTMEDFMTGCKKQQDILKCTAERIDSCEDLEFNSTSLRKTSQFLETLCNENTEIYQALSRSFECLQPLSEDVAEQCYILTGSISGQRHLIYPILMVPEPMKKCIQPMIDVSCFSQFAGIRCGQEAKETVAKIILNVDIHYCNEENILEELQPIKEDLDTYFGEEAEIPNRKRRDLSQYLECLQPSAEFITEQCDMLKGIKPFNRSLIYSIQQLTEPVRKCVEVMMDISCISQLAGIRCGPVAKDAVSDTLWSIDTHDCNKESISNELQPLKEPLESALAEAIERYFFSTI